MKEDEFNSPHAALQNVLARLGDLSPRAEMKPAFAERDQAEQLIAVVAEREGHDLNLTPIWAIDHDDLTQSDIVAWSVTSDIN